MDEPARKDVVRARETSSDAFTCSQVIDMSGEVRGASLQWDARRWISFDVDDADAPGTRGDYVVPTLPVEFHCHGVGTYDFSNFDHVSLDKVNAIAASEGIYCVISLFLPQGKFDRFPEFVAEYAEGRERGELDHLLGIALEGPLLGSVGGTPQKGSWLPTEKQWLQLAALGPLGLRYIVLSPDALLPSSPLSRLVTKEHPDIDWIVDALVDVQILPAVGHFQKAAPRESGACVERVLDSVYAGREGQRHLVLTDHLFNDMPRNIKHAWRGSRASETREAELQELRLEEWTLENADQMLGEVPAVLMRAAHEGRLAICMNFDGEHVDLEICRRVVELVKPQNVIAMTDRVDADRLGGDRLIRPHDSSLWYQDDGVVAAGSTAIDRQIEHIRSLGFSEADLWQLAAFTACGVLGKATGWDTESPPTRFSYVTGDRDRYAFSH